ncbi:MAG: SURF1 family protein, partial [Caldimonas sp.]
MNEATPPAVSPSPSPSPSSQRRRGLLVLLATVAAVALTARLGVWQLDRASQKNALQASLDARSHTPALDAGTLARTASGARLQDFRPVVLHGRWLADRTVFLDNRQMDGRVGFFVVTPLALEQSTSAVLVQRGWAARSFTDRAALPRVATPAGVVTVEGTVAPPPSRLFQFDDAASGAIRQNL